MEEDRKSNGVGPKPILLKHPSKRSSSGIVWDEDNLAENERIKATLNPIKCTEPKTPYHELLPDDDVDLEPLALDGEARAAGASPEGTKAHSNGSDRASFEALRKAHYQGNGRNMRELMKHKPEEDADDDDTKA
ncbi:hypothetical protein FOA52_011948 [Chlamydomonas sp. UWO 241]|nr:hypothetical protein FOA52_011948 [Chlamydomonas sp. UWO 241]